MSEVNNNKTVESYFDGGLLQLIGWRILGFLVTLFTFGICYPWAFCMIYNWETKHTVINGHRLAFDGKAIQLLKEGKRVQRAGWNGKNQYIELATCISYKNTQGEIINTEHEAIGNKAIAFVGTSGVQMGWLASQADMLAEDWKEVE